MAPKKKNPYPGVEHHSLKKDGPPKKSFMPRDGMEPHYSDPPCLAFYKRLLQQLSYMGVRPHGHVDYDKKRKVVIIESELGENVAKGVSTTQDVTLERVVPE